jgi:hypothetical protein
MKVIRYFGQFIDYPSAIAGAVIMGGIVGFINSDHGWAPALTAALKQASYTFLFGGLIIKLLYGLVKNIKNKHLSVFIPTIIVSVLTIALVYLLHSMKGTPKPFASTLPTILMAPPGFFALAWRKNRQMKLKGQQSTPVP